MKYIQFSKTYLKISKIIYGFWRLHEDPLGTSPALVEQKIQTCLEMGINTFDHADLYGEFQNEGFFGKVMKNQPSLRQKIVLISKCGIQFPTHSRPENYAKHYNTSKKYIIYSVERSLKELHTDFLDVLLIHRPNPMMRAEETAEALDSLIEKGKIRYAGVSNFSNTQFEMLDSFMDNSLITNQIELSLLYTTPIEDGTLDLLQMYEVNPMVWSPLAGGRLFTGTDEQALRVQGCLAEMAKKYQASPEQIALAWLLYLPSGALPVIGTNKLERIRESAQSVDIQLELQDWFLIYKASTGVDVP